MSVLVLLLAGYPWLGSQPSPAAAVGARVPPPAGFVREGVRPGSFAEWLRGLPLLAGRPDVKLWDGRAKANQQAHHAVVDIDVGSRDLQQCADAVMRLRAEYLFAAGRAADVRFRATSGDELPFARWAAGERPAVQGNRLRWRASGPSDASHAAFRRYLDTVFTYAGSSSLAAELQPVAAADVQPGDVFIHGGFPGHAVIVVDVVRQPSTGRRMFLLAQSYMPAQQVHVLRNPARSDPWYEVPAGRLVTPEWVFDAGEIRRFRGVDLPL